MLFKTKKSASREPFFTKKRIFKILGEISFFVALLTGLQYWLQRDMAQGKAPDISYALLDNQTLKFGQMSGKPAVVHFWATWCPICRLEQDSISKINERHGDVDLLTVAFQSGDKDEVSSYMQENSITGWPTVLDEDGAIARQYGVNGVPSTFFIDDNGIIRYRVRGYTTGWGLQIRLWLTKMLYSYQVSQPF